MNAEASAVRRWLRERQRTLVLGYLGLVAGGLIVVLLPPTRLAVLGGLEQVVRWWDARWSRRLDTAALQLRTGPVEAAVGYLERLDAIHPATNVRHGRDKERERLLRLLAQGYERQGRTGRAIETYQRLVGFDSLNYRNHLELARAAERLLSGWALAPEARDGYLRVLALFPAHLPSVRGYIDYYMDRGEFIPVVQAFQRYLDAHLVQYATVTIGSRRVELPLIVDGRPREIEVAVNGEGPVRLEIGPLPVAVEAIRATSALRVGSPAGLGPAPSVGVAATGYQTLGNPRYLPVDSTAGFEITSPADTPIGTLTLRIAVYKPMDDALWATVTKSYRNLLDGPGLEAVRPRVVPFGSAAQADAMISRLPWAREGLGVKADDFVF